MELQHGFTAIVNKMLDRRIRERKRTRRVDAPRDHPVKHVVLVRDNLRDVACFVLERDLRQAIAVIVTLWRLVSTIPLRCRRHAGSRVEFPSALLPAQQCLLRTKRSHPLTTGNFL